MISNGPKRLSSPEVEAAPSCALSAKSPLGSYKGTEDQIKEKPAASLLFASTTRERAELSVEPQEADSRALVFSTLHLESLRRRVQGNPCDLREGCCIRRGRQKDVLEEGSDKAETAQETAIASCQKWPPRVAGSGVGLKVHVTSVPSAGTKARHHLTECSRGLSFYTSDGPWALGASGQRRLCRLWGLRRGAPGFWEFRLCRLSGTFAKAATRRQEVPRPDLCSRRPSKDPLPQPGEPKTRACTCMHPPGFRKTRTGSAGATSITGSMLRCSGKT